MAHSATSDSQTIEELKRELRREMRWRRDSLSTEASRNVGDRISDVLAKDNRFLEARFVAMYAAEGGEPDVARLFDLGTRAAKTMLLPRCRERGELSFHAVSCWSDLVVGRFGLREPTETCAEVDVDSIELLIVPCLAVDRRGGRLGRGGGWYDRSLRGAGSLRADVIAAVHSFQIVDRVPCSPADRPVDAIVSESGLIETDH